MSKRRNTSATPFMVLGGVIVVLTILLGLAASVSKEVARQSSTSLVGQGFSEELKELDEEKAAVEEPYKWWICPKGIRCACECWGGNPGRVIYYNATARSQPPTYDNVRFCADWRGILGSFRQACHTACREPQHYSTARPACGDPEGTTGISLQWNPTEQDVKKWCKPTDQDCSNPSATPELTP